MCDSSDKVFSATYRIHVCSGVMTSVDGKEIPYSSYEEMYIRNLSYCSNEARKVGSRCNAVAENIFYCVRFRDLAFANPSPMKATLLK